MKGFQMKKIAVSTVAAATLFAAMAPAAQATTAVSGNFNVNITLNTVCQVTTPGAIALTYTSLQGSAATQSSGFSVTCTNSLPYSVSISSPSVTDDAVNLAYTLAVGAPVGGGTGTGAAQSYTVDATIGANQSGTCGTASCTNAAATNKTHTVTVTY